MHIFCAPSDLCMFVYVLCSLCVSANWLSIRSNAPVRKGERNLKGMGDWRICVIFENDAGTMRDVSNKRALGLAKYQ